MYRFERLCLYSVKHYAYLFSHIYITLEISYPEGDGRHMQPDSEVYQVLKGSGTLISKGRQQTQMQKDLDFPISESRLHLIT